MNVRDAVIQLLREVRNSLHVKEITKEIIKRGLWSSDGKTPVDTVGARIYDDIKKKGEKSSFVKTAPQTFALKENFDTVSNEGTVFKKSNSNEYFSFLDAAEKVLEQFAEGKAMHYKDITHKALEMNWINTIGKTPDATMNAQLVTDLKRARSKGESGRFIRSSPGYYGLVKWQGSGLSQQIAKHNQEIRKKLHAQLMMFSPDQFEELIGQLLAEMGFESIEVTKKSGDGGIDVRGILQISDVVRIKMAVQAKRWKNNIQSPVVQQVRGSLGVHEQGLIITTSNFSKGARIEANQPDKTPVALMNGDQLVDLLMEYGIGVKRISHDLFELENNLPDLIKA